MQNARKQLRTAQVYELKQTLVLDEVTKGWKPENDSTTKWSALL